MDGFRANESLDRKGMAFAARWPGEGRSLLVFDSLEAHVTDTVKASFKCENTALAVIPGGLTSLLQPLDVSLNKPFKDGVRKKWMQWMADGIHEFTASGRQKKPSEERICSWILQAWNDISAEMITASLLKCGITNNLDGSQDDLVYDSTEDTDGLDDSFIKKIRVHIIHRHALYTGKYGTPQ